MTSFTTFVNVTVSEINRINANNVVHIFNKKEDKKWGQIIAPGLAHGVALTYRYTSCIGIFFVVKFMIKLSNMYDV